VPESDLRPGISAVVCCHNSAAVIVPTMRALAAQRLPCGCGFEVILVDNQCTDGTVSLATGAWEGVREGHSLRVVEERTPGLIHARRKGVAKARFDIVLFIDDDNILAPDGAGTLLSLYRRQPLAAGVGGFVEPLFAAEKPSWFDAVAGTFACTPPGPAAELSGTMDTMSGAGISFRTAPLLSLFHSSLPLFLVGRKGDALSRGEDSELCLRLRLQGGELRYEPSFRLRHALRADRLTWDYVLQARQWYGKADVILRIYRDLLAGLAPPPYADRLRQVESRWQRLQATAGAAVPGAAEGSRQALKRSFLLGQRQGLLEIGADGFESIRQAITGFFPAAQNATAAGLPRRKGAGPGAGEDREP